MVDEKIENSAHIYIPNSENSSLRKRLFEIIFDKTFINNVPITLTSGKISNYYFNTKPTMMDAEGAYLIASLILDISEDIDADLIGGLEMGAVPLAASITAVSHLQNRPINAFFVRKQAKEHGTQNLIEGLKKDDTISGKRIIIVEDVTTTGGSALKAAQTLKEAGAEVAHIITVIDREEGAAHAFHNNSLEFTALFSGNEFKQAGDL